MEDQYNSAHTGAEIDQAVSDVQNNKVAWSSKPQPSATTPKAPGTASAGSESAYARGDHVHPHDGTKINNPTEKADGQVLTYDAASGTWMAKETAGGKQIYMTEYEGTGTYGSGNPNTLTFDFVPAVVFIIPKTTTNHSYDVPVFVPGLTHVVFWVKDYSSVSSFLVQLTVTWSDDGKTMTWYMERSCRLAFSSSSAAQVFYSYSANSTMGPVLQLNSSDATYSGTTAYKVIALRSE